MALATRDARIFASVGIHPNEKLAEEPSEAEIVSLASHPRVVAIGETGLNYYRDHNTSESQRERFRRHISAARSVKKPLIIHCREARKEEGADAVGGVMHCFADDWETALKALELNFLISFSGIVTFNSASQLKNVATRLPMDKILVETDAPWLTPAPPSGKNQSAGLCPPCSRTDCGTARDLLRGCG